MQAIVSPLEHGNKGPTVANLHAALTLLIERKIISADKKLQRRLADDAQASEYGDATKDVIGSFQNERGLPVTGIVDKATAHALNMLLSQLGELDDSGKDAIFVVGGRITDRQGKALGDLVVRAFDQDTSLSSDVLGEAVTQADGRYTIRFTREQFKPGDEEGAGPDVFIRVFAGREQLGESQVQRNAKQEITINVQLA